MSEIIHPVLFHVVTYTDCIEFITPPLTPSPSPAKLTFRVCVVASVLKHTFDGERLAHRQQLTVRVDGYLEIQQGFVHDEGIENRRIGPSPQAQTRTHTHVARVRQNTDSVWFRLVCFFLTKKNNNTCFLTCQNFTIVMEKVRKFRKNIF